MNKYIAQLKSAKWIFILAGISVLILMTDIQNNKFTIAGICAGVVMSFYHYFNQNKIKSTHVKNVIAVVLLLLAFSVGLYFLVNLSAIKK